MRPFLRPDFPMHDNKYYRINTLASKEADRNSVADRVAAFLAAGGKVQPVDHTANQCNRPGYGRKLSALTISRKRLTA